MSNSMFSNSKLYAGNWTVKSIVPISEEDKNRIQSAHVVNSQYGLSACFIMKSGGMFFKGIDNQSNVAVGDPIDINTAKLVTLQRQGDADIQKIRIVKEVEVTDNQEVITAE